MSERVVVKWTPAAKDLVYRLWDEAMSGTAIAERVQAEHGLPVTKNSVIGLAFRAGMAFRAPRSSRSIEAAANARPPLTQEERRLKNAERKARKRALNRGTAPTRKRRPASVPRPAPIPCVAPAPRPVAAKSARPEILPSLRIPLTAVRGGMCRFIADDPVRDGPATCCGHPSMSGSAWCAGHHALCTVAVRKPVSIWMPADRRAA